MERVYPFTNENLSSYKNLYNFDNAKVLSVLGSGNQYFSSLLYGAKNIELYDCNFVAWDFFVLKYEEFYDFFVTKRLDNLKCLKKILTYLPSDVANRLQKRQNQFKKLSLFLYQDYIDNKYNSDEVIPYFNKEKYYQLQSLLIKQHLPKFHLAHLQYLPQILEQKSYDIILTSNIFDWLYKGVEVENVKNYKDLLNKFNYGEIQALYCWFLSENLKQELEKYDFQIEQVPGIKTLSLSPDSVISLRNK